MRRLKILKEIRPDSSWKQEARGVLLSQVSNAVGKEVRFGVFERISFTLKNIFSFMPQAAWGVICLVIALAVGSLGVYAVNYSKPGDSFYTARILKEKAQLAITFDQEEKARLDMKMANNHAKEISEVLADTNYKGDEKKSEQLAQNFEQEINTVKERLSEIGKIQSKNSVAKIPLPAVSSAVSNPAVINSDDVKVGIGDISKATDSKIYVVEAGKDSKGIQIYNPNASTTGVLNIGKIPTTTIAVNSSSSASSTATSTAPVAAMNASDAINITLDKATESFNTKDFTGATNMLEQVGVIIENIGSGLVKGVSELGTATPGVVAAPAGIISTSSTPTSSPSGLK